MLIIFIFFATNVFSKKLLEFIQKKFHFALPDKGTKAVAHKACKWVRQPLLACNKASGSRKRDLIGKKLAAAAVVGKFAVVAVVEIQLE